MSHTAAVLLAALAILALVYILRWRQLRRRAAQQAGTPPQPLGLLRPTVGFIANFFDTLGIGSFAPTTAAFKLFRLVKDELIPGTLNAGHALPTLTQALIFISVVTVDPLTLVTMIAASVVGAWLGAGIVARLPRRAIQISMGVALLLAALLFAAANLAWIPGGGTATALRGPLLATAVAVNFLLGALMMLGIGLYAPCLILVSLLGMSPIAAFPIMMGSCAFLMPVAGMRIIASGRFDARAALGLALGGVPGVLLAAYVVKSLPMVWLRWLVVLVVLYAAVTMLRAARSDARQGAAP